MENAIYCYGNGEILWKVFNGLALIFGSKNFMKSMIGISSVVGILWAFNQSIWGQSFGIFAKSWLMPTLLIFNLVFLPKTTVHIIDEVDSSFKYSVVANVPLGVAFFPSIASKISVGITEYVSQYMSPANNASFAHTGDLFGAKLVVLAKDMRITSPRSRDNIKHFVNRCFVWPYIYSNSQGLKEEALHSNNILGFIRSHPHHWCGSYWEDESGQKTFQTCAQGSILTLKALVAERSILGQLFASRMFNVGEELGGQSIGVQQKLARLIPSAWEQLTGHTQSAFQVMDQFVMINAYKEAKDDDREASNLPRLFPELVALQGARAGATQTHSNLIKGEIAGSYVPMVHGAIFAVLILIFVMVVPMTFMPGGVSIFTTWVKLVFWVALWPPFFAMFEALASMALMKAGLGETASTGGLSIATHSGLTDVAFDMYSYFKSSLLLVPVVSWFIVSGSSYAITQFAGGVMSSVGASAERAGSESVDGNLNFNNQSFENRTMGSVSLGQQTLGPNTNFGSSLNTGGATFTHDSSTGHVHMDQHASQRASNISSTDNFAASLNKEIIDSSTATQEHRSNFEESSNKHLQSALAVTDEASKGNIAITSLSDQENRDFSKLVEQANHTSSTYGGESAIENRNASSNDLKANVGIKAGGALVQALGIEIGASADTSMSSSASASAISKIARDNGWNESEKELFTRGVQNIKMANVEGRDEASERLSKEHRSNFEDSKQASDSLSASLTYSKNLQTAKGLSDRGEITVSSNLNDEVMDHVAHTKFGGDYRAAQQWSLKNNDEWIQAGSEYAQNKSGTLFNTLKGNTDLSEEQVKNYWHQGQSNVTSNVVSQEHDKDIQNQYDGKRSSISNTIDHSRDRIENKYTDNSTRGSLAERVVNADIKSDNQDFEHMTKQERSKSLSRKSFENIAGIDSPLGESVESKSLSGRMQPVNADKNFSSSFEDEVLKAQRASTSKREVRNLRQDVAALKEKGKP